MKFFLLPILFSSVLFAGVIDLERGPIPSREIRVCWNAVDEATRECSKQLEQKLEKEINGRTKYKLSFEARCDENPTSILVKWNLRENNTSQSYGSSQLGPMATEVRLICEYSKSPPEKQGKNCGSSSETARLCVENIGLHEFGHALGLGHEDKRPETCRTNFRAPVLADKVAVLTEYDAHSIMNLCYYADVVGTQSLALSELDVLSLNKVVEADPTLPRSQCGKGYTYFPEQQVCLIGTY